MALPRISTTNKVSSKEKEETMSTGNKEEETTRCSLSPSVRSSIQSKIDHVNMPPVYKIPLWALNCQFGIIKKSHAVPALMEDAIRHERKAQKANVTIVFAIRQAGCASCREHGLQLAELAAKDRKVALMATVKKTDGKDKALLDFYTEFFNRYPIYMDEKWELYRAMGGRKMGFFKLISKMAPAHKRYEKKKIWHEALDNIRPKHFRKNFMLGGVLVFDRTGTLTFVLEENPGVPFDMERLEAAIEEARLRSGGRGSSEMTSSEITREVCGVDAQGIEVQES